MITADATLKIEPPLTRHQSLIMAELESVEWEIKDLQNRYKAMKGVDLNNEQAEKMLRYEHEKNLASSKYFFSTWEELDYEEANFREILSVSQFAKYMSGRPVQLKQIEESLRENDNKYLPQLNAAVERLDYYRDTLVPSLRKRLVAILPALDSEKEKVAFLKSAYKRYLAEAKKLMLVEHFRHCKTYQPVILKVSLLAHEQMCLIPDYFSFKAQMDMPTKAIADYIQEKLMRILDTLSDSLKEAMDELRQFNTNNTAKHIGETSGWHVTLPKNSKADDLMFVVLFDPDNYIC